MTDGSLWVPPTPTSAEAVLGLAAGIAGRAAAPLAQAAVRDGMARLFRGGKTSAAEPAAVSTGEVG
ncbi:MAG TPA: hypothetical protein VGP53_09205 [Acidimicrobiales bacterium]|nr:hypothetical protein [Acidimicrobiales bacterium]